MEEQTREIESLKSKYLEKLKKFALPMVRNGKLGLIESENFQTGFDTGDGTAIPILAIFEDLNSRIEAIEQQLRKESL